MCAQLRRSDFDYRLCKSAPEIEPTGRHVFHALFEESSKRGSEIYFSLYSRVVDIFFEKSNFEPRKLKVQRPIESIRIKKRLSPIFERIEQTEAQIRCSIDLIPRPFETTIE